MNRLEELKIMLRKSKNTRPSDDLDKSIVRIIEMMIEDEKSQQVLIRPVIKIKGKGDMSEIVNKLNNDKLEKQVNNQITELKLLTGINKDLHATIAKLKAENKKQDSELFGLELALTKQTAESITKIKKLEDAFKGLMQFVDKEKMGDIFTKFGEMLKNGGLDA